MKQEELMALFPVTGEPLTLRRLAIRYEGYTGERIDPKALARTVRYLRERGRVRAREVYDGRLGRPAHLEFCLVPSLPKPTAPSLPTVAQVLRDMRGVRA